MIKYDRKIQGVEEILGIKLYWYQKLWLKLHDFQNWRQKLRLKILIKIIKKILNQ